MHLPSKHFTEFSTSTTTTSTVMKKISLLFTSVLVATASYAANINWTISGVASKVCYDYSGSSPLQSSVYLIIADDLSSLAGFTTESEFLDGLNSLTLNSTYSTSNGKKPSVSGVTVSSEKLSGGTSYSFGLLTYTTDSEGNGWYKIGTATETAWADGTDARDQKTVSTSWATMANSTWQSAWTKQDDPGPGPQPDVPEPATGALALAGVALLFKRRRA